MDNFDFGNLFKSRDYLITASKLASELNVELYIVGGYIRDILIGRSKYEIDFLVIGDGTEFAQKYARALQIENISIFKNFGTAHFKYREFDFEFVGARKESYSTNSRNPKVQVGSFEDDIARRDFTINTLAVSLNENNFGKLIDLYNGVDDLEKNFIRTPLNPFETFNDDPLRILRAFRFAAQLQFEVSDEIMTAAKSLRERLKIISQERITNEFLKILSSPKPSVGLKLLNNSGVLEIIFPEITKLGGVEQRDDHHHKDVFLHTCIVVDNLAEVTENVWLRFAGLVHDIAKPMTKKFFEEIGWTFHGHEEIGARIMKGVFKRLKLPLYKLNYVEKLVRLHLRPIALVGENVTDSAIRRLIVSADEDLDDLITLCRADITSKNPNKVNKYLSNYELVMEKVKEVRDKDALRAFQSPVKGEEIMEIFNLQPSKKVGIIKTAIEDAILDGEIPNTYEAAKEFLDENKKKFAEL
ncbi:MAG: CCA tRNA nucleotidyltransferase [Bacteroidetes bacterium]|nr:CCA tRNA nucleotidyltransferase [Bacteroidota bacterium]MBU1677868.1 CCA tRNA nucleotidyltransferase [Bacteroidota bacterium]